MTINDLISQPLAYGLNMDSEEVEAALAALNIDPTNCTISEVILALQTFTPPARVGAPTGNRNAKKPQPRLNLITARFNPTDYAAIIAAANANNQTPSEWVRNAAIAPTK